MSKRFVQTMFATVAVFSVLFYFDIFRDRIDTRASQFVKASIGIRKISHMVMELRGDKRVLSRKDVENAIRLNGFLVVDAVNPFPELLPDVEYMWYSPIAPTEVLFRANVIDPYSGKVPVLLADGSIDHLKIGTKNRDSQKTGTAADFFQTALNQKWAAVPISMPQLVSRPSEMRDMKRGRS